MSDTIEGSKSTRRSFIGKLAAGALAAGATPHTISSEERPAARILRSRSRISANDNVQLAIIGAGGMGNADLSTALEVPGVELVAVCDLYQGRIDSLQQRHSQGLFATRDYREILARDDIDAVIVATPDHWHQQISIDALHAGKAVYCEKPMVHTIGQGQALIDAERETGVTFQVGSQGMSSLGNAKAKELLEAGAIGQLNYAEGFWARNSPGGAWQYGLPGDASEETVDWDRFLGSAPARPFDPLRFFRWRNYQDYGTGVAGDLFVHLFSSLHYITSSLGPRKVVSQGGLRHWKDGRDVPDVMIGMFDYPESDAHPPFNLSLRVNFVDGVSGDTVLRLVGNEGALEITWTEVILRRNRSAGPMDVFAPRPEDELANVIAGRRAMLPPAEAVYMAENGYRGAHFDHWATFINGVVNGEPVTENAEFGLRAAAPALASNVSYFDERIVHWDPVAMRML